MGPSGGKAGGRSVGTEVDFRYPKLINQLECNWTNGYTENYVFYTWIGGD